MCLLLFVVFLNDYGDRRVDRIKRQMFPDGCSPKTIPDGILPASALLAGGLLAGGLGLGLAFYAQLAHGHGQLGWSALGLAALFVAYTFPPLRLNYRGGGEWLEGLGVGIALPLLHIYLQADTLWVRGLWLLPGYTCLALASAVASGLADEQSDRRGGKRTYASEYGNRAARSLVERLSLGGALLWAVCMRLSGLIPAPLGALAVIVLLVNWRRMRELSDTARTNAFPAMRRYKHFLHQGQWRAALLVTLCLVLVGLASAAAAGARPELIVCGAGGLHP